MGEYYGKYEREVGGSPTATTEVKERVQLYIHRPLCFQGIYRLKFTLLKYTYIGTYTHIFRTDTVHVNYVWI